MRNELMSTKHLFEKTHSGIKLNKSLRATCKIGILVIK